MKQLTKQELIKYFDVKESVISTNFPKFCSQQLKKGILITKIGKGSSAVYTIEDTEPQDLDKSYFSTRKTKEENNKDYLDEFWITTYCAENYEVSNYGRIRNKKNKKINAGTITKEGYHVVSINNYNYRTHRIVKQSFDPIQNFDEMTVDHINGIRSDNRLENLRWVSLEENTILMMTQRAELNKELTRIIQKMGYDETLKLLQKI